MSISVSPPFPTQYSCKNAPAEALSKCATIGFHNRIVRDLPWKEEPNTKQAHRIILI